MLLKALLPVAILAVLITIAALILGNPPQAQRGGPPEGPRMVVDVEEVRRGPYAIAVQSYGTVQPRTQSMLVAQVSGQIVNVESAFRPGGFFRANDILVTIDPRDYDADVKIAEANLMDAIQAETQEQARAEQALIDWERLGGGEPPSDLVLRKPQLAAATARAASARSALAKARLDLERTVIRAPFDGRLLRQLVDRAKSSTTVRNLPRSSPPITSKSACRSATPTSPMSICQSRKVRPNRPLRSRASSATFASKGASSEPSRPSIPTHGNCT